MRIKVGGVYKLADKGTIRVSNRCQTDTFDVMRATSETGEVLFYDQCGRILPLDGGKELARFNVVGVVSEPA